MTTRSTATSNKGKPCPFCTLPDGRVVEENEFALLIRDGYPAPQVTAS
jgi:putative hemolysin